MSLFARKIKVEFGEGDRRTAAPLKWLDSFAMRNFTNDPVFDDTLPVADGLIEAGSRVPLERLRFDMEDWFRRKGYLSKDAKLTVSESSS